MKKVYFETYGCQMNKYDSELVAGILEKQNYQLTTEVQESDLILINTCSVREHAETRVFGRLDALRSLKFQKPELLIGVLGCMAVRLKENITERKPFVDFILGPDNYRNLPAVLAKISDTSTTENLNLAEVDSFEVYGELFPAPTDGVSAWVAIMRGCNNFCSYCIVPYVRGRERSRKIEEILAEVRKLAQQHYVEVTLLGQNVNSYRDQNFDFADLIRKVAEVAGIKRVRFATSHPKDLSMRLIDAIAGHPNICNHIHLPVQSGSNKILKMMNRNYTREHFIELAASARNKIQDLGLYTDIIVGFPGESEADFEDTLKLIEQIKFDGSFIFRYSPRQGTAAANLKETLTEEQKVKRLQILNQVQDKITLRNNQQLIGKIFSILVEGPSKKAKPNQYMGRTQANKIVVFDSPEPMSALFCNVKIIDVKGRTLFGELV